MPGNRPHHSDRWRRCVEEVQGKGHDEGSASAICTTSLQNAGESIFEAAEAGSTEEIKMLENIETPSGTMEELHLCGAIGQVRYETLNGRRHLVVPVTALMEGVIHPVNAETPEFVSADVLRRAAASWIGKPGTLGHPKKNGTQCSAADSEIRKASGFAVLMKSEFDGKKLLQEAWIDEEKAKQIHPVLYKDLEDGKPVEVSVGAFVATRPKESTFNGKPYKAEWLAATGDHLAFLPGGRGACSCEMGCGTHRAAEQAPMHLVTAESIEFDAFLDLGTRFIAAMKMMECETCGGTGQVKEDGKQSDCPRCEGMGRLKAAAGARHSSSDMKMIQTVHDHAVSLGAMCDRKNLETAADKPPAIPPAVRREGTKWVLYSTDGLRRLATHDTEADARTHEQAYKKTLAKCG